MSSSTRSTQVATVQFVKPQALRRHPVAYLPLIDQHVSEMMEKNIIEPRFGSEWISNVVLVRKKVGSLRYCIDYCNAVTQKANYPLPRMLVMIRWVEILCFPVLIREARIGK